MALARRFGQRRSTQASRERLTNHRREGGERWGTVAADVQFHTGQGYQSFGAAEQEELALHAFLQALTPERLHQHVIMATPRSLDEALKEAERAEDVLCLAPSQTACWRRKSAGHAHPHSSDDSVHRRYDVAAATAVTSQDT
ncbi:hypothetical protein AAFF_G00382080 [Aldrovandia affinis]|uniref:Uncharacterized protein n=1 Tax=Aldrovandia affinis TaxID=143900 RepID=A0AAD7X058_9TELE|nr:hypothetical protein AAFF_G00382080 [Aldrovandia affinis]